MQSSTLSDEEEPEFLRNDPGLACLLAQLERVNQQIEKHELFKERVTQAEKQFAELKAKAAASETSASMDDGQLSNTTTDTDEWETHWDDAVGAWYYFNPKTGEASWLPPSLRKKYSS
jgi:hypothetical protein